MTQTVLLGNLVDISSSKRIFYSEYVEKGVPFYRSKEIIEKAAGKSDISTELFISEDRFKKISDKFGAPQAGDLLLTSVGTLGIPYLVQRGERFYFKDGNLTWFRHFKPELNKQYLLYWLTSQSGKNELLNHTIGSTQKALTIQGLKKVRVPLPPIETQKKIADILRTIDEKIELNRKMNGTLEQIGQALFRHYFIDNPEVEKWERVPLSELCRNVASGGTPSTRNESYYGGNVLWFSTKELQDSFLFGSEKTITEDGLAKSAAKLFPVNTVTMAIYAAPTVGRLGILTKEASFNQATCGLVAKPEVGYEFIYLYLLLSRAELNNMANGAAQQNISVGKVRNFKVMSPDAGSLKNFKEKIEPVFEQIKNNSGEIQTLTTLRGTLLPRLISGKVKV